MRLRILLSFLLLPLPLFPLLLLFDGFSRQGFLVALEPVLELALIDQVGLELTEICLPLPPQC